MTASKSNTSVKINFEKITAHKIGSVILEVHPKDNQTIQKTSDPKKSSTIPVTARNFVENRPNSIGPLVYVDNGVSHWYIHVTAYFKEHVQWEDISLPETANIHNINTLVIKIENKNFLENEKEKRFHWELIFAIKVTPEVKNILENVNEVDVEIDFNEIKEDEFFEGDPRRGTRVILT